MYAALTLSPQLYGETPRTQGYVPTWSCELPALALCCQYHLAQWSRQWGV